MAEMLSEWVVLSEPSFTSSRDGSLAQLTESEVRLASGGARGTTSAQRRMRGQLLCRVPIELPPDPDSASLPLSPSAAKENRFSVDGGIITGDAVVSGVESILLRTNRPSARPFELVQPVARPTSSDRTHRR